MKEENQTMTEEQTARGNVPAKKRNRRPVDEKRALVNRLRRIEGQVRGIQAMIEKGADLANVLVQTSAVNAAVNAFNRELLAVHIRGSVTEGIKNGDEAVVNDLANLVQKLMK